MTARQALAFIRKHGVVLEAAQGPGPSLAEVIAGEPVRGSWWSHPKSHEIFAVTRAIRDSDDVLVCRLIKGKITFVHRRMWPALVRAAGRLPSDLCRRCARSTRARESPCQQKTFFLGFSFGGAAGAALTPLGGGGAPKIPRLVGRAAAGGQHRAQPDGRLGARVVRIGQRRGWWTAIAQITAKSSAFAGRRSPVSHRLCTSAAMTPAAAPARIQNIADASVRR